MILEEIFVFCKQDLAQKKEQISYKNLEKICEQMAKTRRFKDVLGALKKNPAKFNIIAEVKKASPSKGVIRADFEPLKIAQNYDKNGAAAISVLSEARYFQGNLEFIEQIAPKVEACVLRKDFIFDEYQILQTLASGADFLLLIARALEKGELARLAEFAHSLKLAVLCEVHNENDLEKALFANAQIIGINHRNLSDFSMNMNLCEALVPRIASDKIIVAESGLNSKETLAKLDEIGVDAFLIGEYFMRQNDEGKALKALAQRI